MFLVIQAVVLLPQVFVDARELGSHRRAAAEPFQRVLDHRLRDDFLEFLRQVVTVCVDRRGRRIDDLRLVPNALLGQIPVGQTHELDRGDRTLDRHFDHVDDQPSTLEIGKRSLKRLRAFEPGDLGSVAQEIGEHPGRPGGHRACPVRVPVAGGSGPAHADPGPGARRRADARVGVTEQAIAQAARRLGGDLGEMLQG